MLECTKAEDSEKLLLLTVDIGSEKRNVVSGIAAYYKPEELIGRNIILVANLKTAVIRGHESRGMILASDCGKAGVKVIFADDSAAPGSKVR